jgi:hypothetical protein
MKGFGKIALVFGLLAGVMAYFIVPVQFSRKRPLSPAEKAEYALTVNFYKRHCGPVTEEFEERAKAYAAESREAIWAGYDAMLQHRGLVIGSPAWCRYIRAQADARVSLVSGAPLMTGPLSTKRWEP